MTPSRFPFPRFTLLLGLITLAVTSLAPALHSQETATPPTDTEPAVIDATTLQKKVLVGYQGWFRAPGDAANIGWRHWSRDGRKLTPSSLTFEMWPDMSEYTTEEKYAAPGFEYPDGSPAHLFSSAHPKTVERHFQWMKQYGIDGVLLQRFLVDLRNPSIDQVLDNVQKSAESSGRVFAIGYDLSGAPPDKVYDILAADWKRLVEQQKLTKHTRYLHHQTKPVVFVFGFYSDRFAPEVAHKIIDLFKSDSPYQATLIGGCQWYWRQEKNPEWARAFRRFDVISPWNVGNYGKVGEEKHASTGYWKDDKQAAHDAGMQYLPVIYPGFGWRNLTRDPSGKNDLPRLGGRFFWKQFNAAADLKMEMAYVAMFDEVDEGTAIFKVTNRPPKQAYFSTYEGLPPDWYLRLTGAGSKLLRGEIPPSPEIPLRP